MSLQELDLSRNNLSGQIPKYLEQLTFLQYLNLFSIVLRLRFQHLGVFQTASAVLVTGNKKLCGGIPKLQLSICSEQGVKKQGRAFSPKAVIIGVIASAVCLFLLLCFLVFRC